MNKIEIKLYRHKIFKDIYLIRNWSICGGGTETEWFEATQSLKKAIENLWRYDNKHDNYYLADLEKEIKNHFFENGESKLKAEITLKKEVDFDGYKGTLYKNEKYSVNDFEPFILGEVKENR